MPVTVPTLASGPRTPPPSHGSEHGRRVVQPFSVRGCFPALSQFHPFGHEHPSGPMLWRGIPPNPCGPRTIGGSGLGGQACAHVVARRCRARGGVQ